jgi:hypothetical protein
MKEIEVQHMSTTCERLYVAIRKVHTHTHIDAQRYWRGLQKSAADVRVMWLILTFFPVVVAG